MKNIQVFIFLACLEMLFSCAGKQTDTDQKTKSSSSQPADSSKKIVTQNIGGEIVQFDYSDFNDLKNNNRYERFFAGNLSLTTGKVVCTDPMYRELGLPQDWTVLPGNYPVYLYIGREGDFGGRIAYAELVIKNEVPAEWKMSLIPEHLLTDSFEIQLNGMYPVENGLSSFSDYETFMAYDQEIEDFYSANKNGNFFNDVLSSLFKKNREEDWVNYKPKQAKANIIMFGAGMGDGLFPRYVGYDKNKNVVRLVTDFVQNGANSKK